MLKLMDVLSTLTDPRAIETEVDRRLAAHLGADRAFHGDVSAEGIVSITTDHCNDDTPSIVGRYRLDAFGGHAADALRSGRTLVFADVAAAEMLTAAEKQACRDARIAALVKVPQLEQGRLVAVLAAHQSQPRNWQADEIALVEDVAERTWAVLQRARAEAALRENEVRQAFLLNLGDVLRPLADPAEIQQAAMKHLGEHLDVTRATYFEVAADQDGLTASAWRAREAPSLPGRMRLSDFSPDLAARYRAGETLQVRDTESGVEGESQRDACRAIGVRAWVGVPLVKRERLLAVVGIHSSTPRDWTDAETRLIEDVAQRTWSAVERARAEAALRQSEQHYRALFNSIDEGFCTIEVLFDDSGRACDYRFLAINAAFVEQTGLENALGRTIKEMVPGQEAHWFDADARIDRTGKAERFEQRADALGRCFDVFAFPLGTGGSHEVGVLFRDILAHKRAEEASSRLAAIVEFSDDAIIRKDLDGIIQTWNAGAERMFGYAADEVIGKSITILMPPGRVDEEPAILARIRRGERIDHYETIRQRKDGSRLDVSLSISPIRDATGTIVAASKIARDVTRRKRAEAVLRESEERQGFLLMVSDAMREQADEQAIGEVCVRMLAGHLDLDRCCISHLSRAEDRVRLGAEHRRPDLPSIFGESGDVTLSDFPEIIRRLETEPAVVTDFAADARLSDADRAAVARMRMHAFIAAPLREGERNVTWALVAGSATPRDWTREEVHMVENVAERAWTFIGRARVGARLREREAQLQRASRAKDEFLAMLGHELRNPLAPITTTLELMKLRAPETFARERGVIEGQVRYLTDLVDDLLDVARIARGKIELKLARVDVGEIVKAAVETTQSAMEERRQVLHVDVDDGIAVSGDRRRLVQVLVNLLTNAAKYSPPDRNIHLSAGAEKGQVVVRVRDEGQGIAPDLLQHVFESFSQGSQSIDRARGGLGLGLAIVRNLAELHGGSVTAASDGAYKGSEFTVRLPLLDARPVARGPGAEVAAPRRASAKGRDKRVRVLIVDDYALAADSLA
ncbi:MAG: PAS domain S-box protein, partial [Rhodanobacteraceae bacterium]